MTEKPTKPNPNPAATPEEAARRIYAAEDSKLEDAAAAMHDPRNKERLRRLYPEWFQEEPEK